MKLKSHAVLGSVALCLGLASGSALASSQELLDVLLKNGAIDEAQHTALSKQAQEDEKAAAQQLKSMAWAGKLKIKGDLRLRHEKINDNGGAGDNRARIRARVGVYADVTENVEVGVRLATGGTATSTNETLGDANVADGIFLDLGYFNWEVTDGLELIGGKFKKPWQSVSGGLLWDGDTNPEGFAGRYTHQWDNTEVIFSGGHLILDDVGDLNYNEDQNTRFAQIAFKNKGESLKSKFGIGYFKYDDNDRTNALTTGGGNNATKYGLLETFGEVAWKNGVKVYGHYIKNKDADGVNKGEDTAWLLGVGGKIDKFKLSADYRETELNAVNGAFNDADFAGGRTDSEGWRYKIGYKIDKNFSVGATYIDSETNNLNGNRDIDVFQLDLKAKF